jgi:hypothetical protein
MQQLQTQYQTHTKIQNLDYNMTKKQFHAAASANGCSSHYQGKTQTMFVFGSKSNVERLSKSVTNVVKDTFKKVQYQYTSI